MDRALDQLLLQIRGNERGLVDSALHLHGAERDQRRAPVRAVVDVPNQRVDGESARSNRRSVSDS